MMKKAIKVLTLCLLVAFLTSCQTKEEKVINKLNALAERVESKADSFTDSQWENIYNEFESLQAQTKDCDFTAEQLKEVAKAEAELTAAIAKQKAKEVGNDIKDAINEGKEVLNGIFDGIKEGLGGDEAAEKAE
jgi:predicted ATP-binding protein involved in virulence